MVVTVDLRDLTKFGKKLELLSLNLPETAKKISKNMGEEIAEGMRERVNVWHGNLKGSIKTENTEDGTVVKANFYGRFLEDGHKIVVTNKLIGWAKEKGGEKGYKAILNWLVKHGAKAHPFIQPAIENTINKFEVIAGKEINLAVKKAGIGNRAG